MKMKVILVNFQNEYLSKKGKWYNKSKITEFILTRFIPFCERHKLPVYEIKSDYAAPNQHNRNGCVPGTEGFKSLIPNTKLAGPRFIKADNSPSFIRVKAGEMPVEKPYEFKHWLDENIGDPSQIPYVLILGIGLESSITMVGSEMAKYGYKAKILKEGTDTTNKKYTDFLLDKFPLVSWGSVINFVHFVKEMKKYEKVKAPESNWTPSTYPVESNENDEYLDSFMNETIDPVEIKPEPVKESEKRPINLMTPDNTQGLSKAETIALMKNQMKAQYFEDEKIVDEPAVSFADEDIDMEPVKPAPSKSSSKEDLAEESRRRVEEYYKKMFEEEDSIATPVTPAEPEPVIEPTPVIEPVVMTPITPIVEEVAPIKVEAAPIVKEVRVKVPTPQGDKNKYAYIFDSMIYVENKLYDERPRETTPANFVKSRIINSEPGTRKSVKPKTKNINRISVHERYMLEAEKRRRDNAIKGIKNKPSNGKDESLRE